MTHERTHCTAAILNTVLREGAALSKGKEYNFQLPSTDPAVCHCSVQEDTFPLGVSEPPKYGHLRLINKGNRFTEVKWRSQGSAAHNELSGD